MDKINKSRVTLAISISRRGQSVLTFFPTDGTEEYITAQEIADNCVFASDFIFELLDTEKRIIAVKKETLVTLSEFLRNVADYDERAQAENVTLTREALRVYRAACIVAGASPDDSFSTDEVFNLLHGNGGNTPFDYEVVRYHLEELNNLGLFNLEDEEHAQDAKNAGVDRLMERREEWGLYDSAQDDGSYSNVIPF